MTTPTKSKPPSILVGGAEDVREKAEHRVNIGEEGSTPKLVKIVALTPNEIRRENTFKRRRRPRSSPGSSQLQSRRPVPIMSTLQRSHEQISELRPEGLSERAETICAMCLLVAERAAQAHEAEAQVAADAERARRYTMKANRKATVLSANAGLATSPPEAKLDNEGAARVMMSGDGGARLDLQRLHVGLSDNEREELNAIRIASMDQHLLDSDNESESLSSRSDCGGSSLSELSWTNRSSSDFTEVSSDEAAAKTASRQDASF